MNKFLYFGNVLINLNKVETIEKFDDDKSIENKYSILLFRTNYPSNNQIVIRGELYKTKEERDHIFSKIIQVLSIL